MLTEFLTSQTRAEILRVLFDGMNKEYYLRELERACKTSINSIQKEIKRLSELGLVEGRKDGNRIYYKANGTHPLYTDILSIVEKTVGIIAVLQNRLNDSKIECVFVFGSLAKNQENADSDIDLCVIGDISMRQLTTLLSGLQGQLGREINPHIFTAQEFKGRIEKNDHFISSILKGNIKTVIGQVNDYK